MRKLFNKDEWPSKKLIIQTIFIGSLITSNMVANKIIMVGPLVLPGAVLLYAITFLMTDLINELFGKKEAQKLVNSGFIVSVFATIMIFLTKLMPAAPFAMDVQDAYVTLLGTNFRVVFGSMIAYYVSQTWDVWSFHKLNKMTNGKHKWIRNNVSTMTSQILDTAIFIFIAFVGQVPSILQMIISQYLVKFVIAALDTPFFYFFTRGTRKEGYVVKD